MTPVQKQRAHELLKQSKITFSGGKIVDKDKLIFHPQAAAPPIFRVKTNPSPFICQEIHYEFYRYTKNTEGYFVFYNPHSGLLHMSTTNLIIILINLFLSSQLPMKQPINVDQHNIFPPKTGIQDLLVTHYDCSPKHITNMQYYKINKIGECKIKAANFKILPAQVHIFSQIRTLQVHNSPST